jgi:AraC-like DNA-binding protein
LTPAAFDWVELLVIRDGTGLLFHPDDRESEWIRSGDVVFLMPNVPCGVEPEGQMTMTRLFLALEYMVEQVKWKYSPITTDVFAAQVLWDRTHPEPSQVVRVAREHMARLFDYLDVLSELTKQFRLHDEHYRAGGLVLSTLGLVVPLLQTHLITTTRTQDTTERATLASMYMLKPLRPEVSQARGLIEKHFTEPVPLEWLAEQVHLSRAQLQRLFKGQMGKTPLAYRDSLRVQAMVRLLIETTLRVSEIAHRVGWAGDDQAIEVFREAVGMTPAAYREHFRISVSEIPKTVDHLIHPADLLAFGH